MLRKLIVLLSFFLAQAAYAALAAVPEIKNGFFKTSDGVRLHYLEAGSGPTIVFEPGWSMPAWIWESQIPHFAEHYHVVALDPRAQGESDKSLQGNSIERRAQDIHELVEHLKLSPAVLIGWSLGVSELLSYAEQFGGSQVRGYVLVDGFAWEKQDPQFIAAMLGLYSQLQSKRREFTEKFVRSMYKKPQPDEYVARVIAASLKMPADSAVAASVSSISRADWRPAIAKLDRPVMIMCQTAMKSFAADSIVSALPSTRVEVFEDAGHALFVDDAARFNTVLDDFLQHLPTQ
ncbi:MAG TPA: alpha/beta hydrolase [Candidatus Dormibacteraeota bacterium]|nr:alpha/beta hydrolase [Candidatus Dormibacteraeota bacterium]